MKRQLEEDKWRSTLEINERRARAMGIKESDIPRLIAESRRERRVGNKVLRLGREADDRT